MSDSNEPPTKRQKHDEKRPLLKDLPFNKFFDMIDLFRGPEVTITVEGQDFKLPRALLCYNSKHFDRAFNGGFKETTEQKMKLTSCSVETFKILVQWLYTSQIVLGNKPEGITEVEHMSQQVTTLLLFFKLADEIILLGSLDDVVQLMRVKIIADRSCLKPLHIREAAQLPTHHAVRIFLAQACVKDYIKMTFTMPGAKRPVLWYQAELDEVDSFAADLLRETEKALGMKKKVSRRMFQVQDPLSGHEIEVECCIG